MNDLLQVVILGIVEGITEFLPVSSTGHLLVAEDVWLGQRSDMFNVVIQAGAILAITLVYRQRLWQLLRGFAEPANRDYALKLLTAFGITAVLGLVITKLGFKLPDKVAPVAWALLIGGIWMIGAEALAAKRSPNREVSWTVAIVVGLAQIVAAIFPGTSRSGATIFAAMLAGTSDRAAATEFSFLVGIPTMYAASGYELLKQLRHAGPTPSTVWVDLGIGFTVSLLVAFVAVVWLLHYIRSHRFTAFAVYRILFGAALLAFVH